MDAAFNRAQAEYDAMEPPEYCPHDTELTHFVMDSGHRYLVCADCYEILPDPEDDDEHYGRLAELQEISEQR